MNPLRTWARRSPTLLGLYLRWKGRSQLGVYPGRTAICIEAYPRSANSSTFRKFKIANPDAMVAHHTHTVGNLAAAVRHGIPTLVLIRRPPEPILSTLVAMRTPDPDDALSRYLDFYGWVERRLDALVLADFERVLEDWNGVIRAVNTRFGTRFALHGDSEEADRRMKDFIQKRMDAEAEARHVTNMPLPSAERTALKEQYREVVEGHALYPEALGVFRRLLPHCVGRGDAGGVDGPGAGLERSAPAG